MAAARAQRALHLGSEGLQQVQGDKGLDGAGEAAAVDPAGAPAVQGPLGHRQGHGHGLLLDRPGGGDVLEQLPGGAARLLHQGQEGVHVAPLQGVGLLLRPPVVGKEVEGPEDRPVPGRLPQLGQLAQHLRLVHLPQHLLAEEGGHRPHLLGMEAYSPVRAAWLAPESTMHRA